VTPDPTWRKASRSQSGPNCVELRRTLDQLRDSKNPGPTLLADVPALISAIKRGDLG
jgi:Domain of unknown function (DUF397)